jgi:hypothetical protein
MQTLDIILCFIIMSPSDWTKVIFFIQLTGEVNCISHDYLTIMFLSSHLLNPMPSTVTILDGLWFVHVCCPFFLGGEDSGFLSFIIGFSTLGG